MTRQKPTILCSRCYKRKPKRGSMRSKATGNYYCRDCQTVIAKGEK